MLTIVLALPDADYLHVLPNNMIYRYNYGLALRRRKKLHYNCEQVLFVRFYNNPAPVIRSMQFHYCTVSNPGTGADDAFVLKRCVLRNATWPSHSRPAIAAGARQFQICFLP